MKASAFAYHRAADKREALDMLATLENSKLIAGGQSLMPMLNLRIAAADNLIDLNKVAGLSGIEAADSSIRIGAMTRQRTLYEDELLRQKAPIVAAALRFVGHLHTRNRGTIGGSLAHMDPAAELMNIAALFDATVHVESAGAKRDISITDFPVGFMTPQLEPEEMITAVTLQLPRSGHGWSFHEFAQRHGDFAIVAVGVTMTLSETDGCISDVRIALSGVDFAPRRLGDIEDALRGIRPDVAAIAAAAELAARGDAIADIMASAAYRQHLAKVLTRRALSEAFSRARGAYLQ